MYKTLMIYEGYATNHVILNMPDFTYRTWGYGDTSSNNQSDSMLLSTGNDSAGFSVLAILPICYQFALDENV